MPKYSYILKLKEDVREIHADSYEETGNWICFYRNPLIGGPPKEFLKVRRECVISIGIEQNAKT